MAAEPLAQVERLGFGGGRLRNDFGRLHISLPKWLALSRFLTIGAENRRPERQERLKLSRFDSLLAARSKRPRRGVHDTIAGERMGPGAAAQHSGPPVIAGNPVR